MKFRIIFDTEYFLIQCEKEVVKRNWFGQLKRFYVWNTYSMTIDSFEHDFKLPYEFRTYSDALERLKEIAGDDVVDQGKRVGVIHDN